MRHWRRRRAVDVRARLLWCGQALVLLGSVSAVGCGLVAVCGGPWMVESLLIVLGLTWTGECVVRLVLYA